MSFKNSRRWSSSSGMPSTPGTLKLMVWAKQRALFSLSIKCTCWFYTRMCWHKQGPHLLFQVVREDIFYFKRLSPWINWKESADKPWQLSNLQKNKRFSMRTVQIIAKKKVPFLILSCGKYKRGLWSLRTLDSLPQLWYLLMCTTWKKTHYFSKHKIICLSNGGWQMYVFIRLTYHLTHVNYWREQFLYSKPTVY